MKLPRRMFLQLTAGAAALPTVSRIARAQAYPAAHGSLCSGSPALGRPAVPILLIGTRYRTKAGTWGALLIVAAMFYSPPVLAQTGVPKYEVDPFWPKLPNNWVVGPLGGTCVDTRDHVFVLHRQEELTEAVLTARDQFAGGAARIKAPPVMEFDPEGNLVNSWGDMKVLGNYLHDCQVDKDGNLWIAAARSGFVQKYSHDGKLLLQIGKSGVFDSSDGTAKGKPLNSNTAQFFGPSAVDVDPANGDVYVADGHGGGNFRVAVLDKNGTFLRQFRLHHTEAEKNIAELPHCMRLSHDGLVYVCDRLANRLQAFDKMGTFIRNIDIPWKNYTAENEDLRKYCHMLWRTFPPCSLLHLLAPGLRAGRIPFVRAAGQDVPVVESHDGRIVLAPHAAQIGRDAEVDFGDGQVAHVPLAPGSIGRWAAVPTPSPRSDA